VQELLALLHGHGYRLRKLSGDSIEVAEAGPTLAVPVATAAPAEPQLTLEEQKELEQKEADDLMFGHVGGRPDWLRRPERKIAGSPWKDQERGRD